MFLIISIPPNFNSSTYIPTFKWEITQGGFLHNSNKPNSSVFFFHIFYIHCFFSFDNLFVLLHFQLSLKQNEKYSCISLSFTYLTRGKSPKGWFDKCSFRFHYWFTHLDKQTKPVSSSQIRDSIWTRRLVTTINPIRWDLLET